jgi:hypothetical protein
MKPAFVVACLPIAAACSPTQYTPPTRMIAFDSPIGPAAGHTDVQGTIGSTAELFGPSVTSAEGRVRQAVTDAVVVEGEAGILHVSNEGSGDNPDRNAFTGRVGAMLRSADAGDLRAALSAGIGAGYSAAAGGWGGIDVGASVALRNKYVRPFAGVDMGWSHPFGARTFTISDGDDSWQLQLQPTFMGRVTFGLELGPPDETAIIGVSVDKPIYTSDLPAMTNSSGSDAISDDDAFISLGLGFRAEL